MTEAEEREDQAQEEEESKDDKQASPLTKEQTHEMALKLIDEELDIKDVPQNLHHALYSALSLFKFEARIGGLAERYDRINEIMWAMKFTPVMPEASLYMPKSADMSTRKTRDRGGSMTGHLTQTLYTHNVTLVKAVTAKGETNGEAKLRRLEHQLEAAEEYWKDEVARFCTLREKAIRKLKKEQSTFKFSSNSVTADEQRNELDYEMDELQKQWLAKERKMNKEMDDEISGLKAEIRKLNELDAGQDSQRLLLIEK